MPRRLTATIFLCLCLGLTPSALGADGWVEIKSPHFTIWSVANDGNTRTLLWQLEQVRSALVDFWPWAKVDLPKPLLIFAIKDESGMKTMAPMYWEQKGATHPASVSVTGADRHYMAIRTDAQGEERLTPNPYLTTYSSYPHLIPHS